MQLFLDTRINEAIFANLIFVNPGIKINGVYYRDMLLKQMLPNIRAISGKCFIIQNSAPTGTHETATLLQWEVPAVTAASLWPTNNPDLSPVD